MPPGIYSSFVRRALLRRAVYAVAHVRALYVHHAKHAVSDAQFLPTYGANAGMLNILCLWVATVKMKVCLDWVLARANRNLFKLAFAKP